MAALLQDPDYKKSQMSDREHSAAINGWIYCTCSIGRVIKEVKETLICDALPLRGVHAHLLVILDSISD